MLYSIQAMKSTDRFWVLQKPIFGQKLQGESRVKSKRVKNEP